MVRILLEHPAINVHHTNVYGYSALYWANRHQHQEVVALLVEKGATLPALKVPATQQEQPLSVSTETPWIPIPETCSTIPALMLE